MSQRFEYAENSNAGFVELSPAHPWGSQDLWEALKKVAGVRDVAWQSSKSSQQNFGSHHMEQNIKVYSELCGKGRFLEFEVTRNQHMSSDKVPYAVSVCFKGPQPDLVPEAWRILCAVTEGKELFPDHVARYKQKQLGRFLGRVPEEPRGAEGASSEAAPGSASAAPSGAEEAKTEEAEKRAPASGVAGGELPNAEPPKKVAMTEEEAKTEEVLESGEGAVSYTHLRAHETLR